MIFYTEEKNNGYIVIRFAAMKFSFIYTVFFLFLAGIPVTRASDIRIGLFYDREIQSAVFTVVQGEYILFGDGKQIKSLRRGSILLIDYTADGVAIQDTAESHGGFDQIEFRGISSENVFSIKPVYPSFAGKESDDDLLVGVAGQNLRIINRLDLEKYIAGTLEAEGGIAAPVEYYKAQAVLIRTYAVKNFHRHSFEGFNLCDGQHCQAFNGKSRWDEEIHAAVLATEHEVLTDQDGQPANTAYHANCGGMTASAAIEWNEDLPYLTPVNDPFCSESSQYEWRKVISLNEWRQYLLSKGIVSSLLPDNLTQQPARLKYFTFGDRRILISDIRQDLQLRSTFLTISQESSNMIFSGRGYGHGVGLCQEGAMEMARVGFVYIDILMFYFRDLIISQYRSEAFVK
ncbi:MAG: SpoIID/LytB domain-containing protein [Bacteroidales bacterium]|nr:SpoIID/LytB domain-containing protein [Bacteroidales bacterium]